MNGCQTMRLEGECLDDAMRIISVEALKFPKSLSHYWSDERAFWRQQRVS